MITDDEKQDTYNALIEGDKGLANDDNNRSEINEYELYDLKELINNLVSSYLNPKEYLKNYLLRQDNDSELTAFLKSIEDAKKSDSIHDNLFNVALQEKISNIRAASVDLGNANNFNSITGASDNQNKKAADLLELISIISSGRDEDLAKLNERWLEKARDRFLAHEDIKKIYNHGQEDTPGEKGKEIKAEIQKSLIETAKEKYSTKFFGNGFSGFFKSCFRFVLNNTIRRWLGEFPVTKENYPSILNKNEAKIIFLKKDFKQRMQENRTRNKSKLSEAESKLQNLNYSEIGIDNSKSVVNLVEVSSQKLSPSFQSSLIKTASKTTSRNQKHGVSYQSP